MTSSQPFKPDAPETAGVEGSREYTVRALLVEYKTLVTVSALLVVGAFLFTDLNPSVPQWVKLYGTTAVGAILLAYLPAKKVVEWLYVRNYHLVIDIDARDAEFAEYGFSPEQFGELHVCGADGLASRQSQDGTVYLGRSLRYLEEGEEDLTHPLHGSDELNDGEPVYAPETGWYINGTWKASADDLELEAEREKIDEIRRKLELEAQKGLAERIKMPGATRTAVRHIVGLVLEGLERGTIHHGEELQDVVDNVMKSYNMERTVGKAPESESRPETEPRDVGDMSIGEIQDALRDDSAASQNGEVPADD